MKKSVKVSKLFVVFYRVIGSRCSGSWLVNAWNKRDARKLLSSQLRLSRRLNVTDQDYVIDQVQTVEEYSTDMGYDSVELCRNDQMLVTDESRWLEVSTNYGEKEQLECGT